MKNKIIWITGISGTGKTSLAKYFLKYLKNFIWIDGDKFRKVFNNDLGYTLKDRNKNAERLINFSKFLSPLTGIAHNPSIPPRNIIITKFFFVPEFA